MIIVGSTYWNMVYGQKPGDVLKDEEGLANMRKQDEPTARPAISGSVQNIEQYDTVLLGFPIWLAYHKLIQCTQLA